MTKRQFPPCFKCGGWVYEELDRQEEFDVLVHRCINCATEQDSKIILKVKSLTEKVIKEQNGTGL